MSIKYYTLKNWEIGYRYKRFIGGLQRFVTCGHRDFMLIDNDAKRKIFP